nr:ral guanine nucleotide dissociation stimulator-like isoform X2 [Equus asinus]
MIWTPQDGVWKLGDMEDPRSSSPLEPASPASLPPGAWEPHCLDDSQTKHQNQSALNLGETCRLETVKAGRLEKLVEHQVPALQSRSACVLTCPSTYCNLASTQHVMVCSSKAHHAWLEPGALCPPSPDPAG